MQVYPSGKQASFLQIPGRFSYESVRIWYHKMARVSTNSKKYRRCIAIDEIKIKIGNKYWYVWAAIDVDSWEIVSVMVTEWRTSIDAIKFARDILKYCDNKPVIKTDRGPWYRWTLQRLGLKHEYETFGERNAIEGWFNILKARLKRFWKRFPFNASKESLESWITAFVALYNLEVKIS